MVSPETVELVYLPVLQRTVLPFRFTAVVSHLLRRGLKEDIVSADALHHIIPHSEHSERLCFQLRIFGLYYFFSRSRLQLLLNLPGLSLERKRSHLLVSVSLAAGGKANEEESQYGVFQYLGHIFSIFRS